MNQFIRTWIENSRNKNSRICAGLDPAPFAMGRGEKGLAKNADLLVWSLAYVDAVADEVCAIKYNSKYWTDEDALRNVIRRAKDRGLQIIEDGKFADITDTNESAIFWAKDRGADAVTIAAFAGNYPETLAIAKRAGLASIGMCLMSNPEYSREKNLLCPELSENIPESLQEKTIRMGDHFYLPRYLYLANQIRLFGGEGAVIGSTGHILEEELEAVSKAFPEDSLILSPGFGAQGGQFRSLKKYFSAERIIVSASRGLMFPKGSASTPEDQKNAAQNLLNEQRKF